MSTVDGAARPASRRVLAGVLGILFGGLGLHRFAIGDRAGGLLRIALTIATLGIATVIGIVEGIRYLTRSDEDFVATYQVGRRSWF